MTKYKCPHLDNVGGCTKTVGHKMCNNISTESLITLRDNINTILEVRSQEIMKESLPEKKKSDAPSSRNGN